MARRMDRYNLNNSDNEIKRSNKNQELYQNIGTNTKYTNFVDVRQSNAYMIDKNNSNNYTRENYQHMKEYTDITPKTRVRKEFDDFNHIYHTDENRIYDINSVLEKAKQQRGNAEEENLRKLKNTNYNILASLNPKELEEYRQEKKNRLKPEVEEGLRELIDTMISKTMAGEISKQTGVDLLSDLMATNAFDRINMTDEEIEQEKQEKNKRLKENNQKELIKDLKAEKGIKEEPKGKEESKKEVLDKESMKKIEEASKRIPGQTDSEIMKNIDQSFYTKSMDLSDKDFFTGDEEDERKIPLIVKIIVFIVILTLIGVGIYFLYQSL